MSYYLGADKVQLQTPAKDQFMTMPGGGGEAGTKPQPIQSCLLIIQQCPLEKYVVLPKNLAEVKYSIVIAGAIRGALEVVLSWMM